MLVHLAKYGNKKLGFVTSNAAFAVARGGAHVEFRIRKRSCKNGNWYIENCRNGNFKCISCRLCK